MERRIIFSVLLLLVLSSCNKEVDYDPAFYSNTEWTEYKVAVIAPLSESKEYRERLDRITDWFARNFHDGQKRLEKGVSLDFEWYDETSLSSDSLKKIGRTLAKRDDLAAIVGPFYSSNVDIIASRVYNAGLPLIVPIATSEDLQRRYSVVPKGLVEKPFMWCISQCDVTQSETLVNLVLSYGYNIDDPRHEPSLGLIAPDDIYGKTFNEWVPFHAVEMGVNLKGNVFYDAGDRQSISESVSRILETESDYAIIAASTASDAMEFVRTFRASDGKKPRLFFTDATFNAQVLSDPDIAESMEGICVYADPESGFQSAYESRFGSLPTPDECMYYDALLLAGMACEASLLTGKENLNSIIQEICSNDTFWAGTLNAWNSLGIGNFLSDFIETGSYSLLRGATGILSFNKDSYTTRQQSCYALWRVVNGKFMIMRSYSSQQENTATWASIDRYASRFQNFGDSSAIQYGPMTDRWAVLVRGSQGWNNYRHLADVLGIYQFLKKSGYDDNHIILICTDDVSQNRKNLHPGEIRGSINGSNLLSDIDIDYGQEDLTPMDICDILTGRSSDRLPTVLETDAGSNIFFYWSGHGENGWFNWPDNRKFTTKMLEETVREMAAQKRFRKLLICTEPCHSSSVVKAVEPVTGVLGIASAYATESSFADIYDPGMSIWLSDRFTNNLISLLGSGSCQTYYDLYNGLYHMTIGSHVKVFNSEHFSNLNKDGFQDFFD